MNQNHSWEDRREHAVQREERLGILRVRTGKGGYLYRPEEILISPDPETVDLLLREVDDPLVQPDEQGNSLLADQGVTLGRWRLPAHVDPMDLARRLTAKAGSSTQRAVPNYVFSGEWLYKGGPAGPPQPAAPLTPPAPFTPPLPPGTTAMLAVLDTGVTDPPHPFIASTLVDHIGPQVDVLDADLSGYLDSEAGHGTFVLGLVQRVAGGLPVQQSQLLSTDGFTDDYTVACRLALTSAPVINLSFGGYTADNKPPICTQQAIAALAPGRVVVAAAGNNNATRKFWPAALDQVIAVAAYDSGTGLPATFSNHGAWVDVCAPGVDLRSSFVTGQLPPDPQPAQFTGWATWSGTSFAAPLLAAQIALQVALGHASNGTQAAAQVLATLQPPPAVGYGRRFDPQLQAFPPLLEAPGA